MRSRIESLEEEQVKQRQHDTHNRRVKGEELGGKEETN